jgi:GT2 family glycosyltransferase
MATPTAAASTDKPVAVTVVVCAYTMKRWHDLVEACTAIDAQTVKPAQVILVIDHNDELELRARTELATAHPLLSVQPNRRSRGLSGARNTAIDACTTPLIAFLDDDACPDERWLEGLVRPFAEPKVWITGGHSEPRWPGVRPRWFPPEFDWVVGSSYLGMPQRESDVRNVHGCSMAFRSEVFARVGQFDEGLGRVGTLPVGCEETELCIRLAQSIPQARIRYVPSSQVKHRVSVDRIRLGYFIRRCYSEGLSKAQIGRLVGASAGTSDERDYARKVLPAGVRAGLGRAIRGDLDGFLRASAIVTGLAITTVGYARGLAAGDSTGASRRMTATRR